MGLTEAISGDYRASLSPLTASGTATATYELEPHLRRWATRMRAAGMAETTATERPRQIRHLATAEGLDVFRLDEDDILTYLARPELSKASRATYYYGLRAWCTYLLRAGIRTDNPMHGITCPKVPAQQIRPITSGHVRALLASGVHARTRGMILLGAYAGLRAHEIAQFHCADLDPISGVMRVVGKGDKERFVPVHPLITEYARLRAPESGYWFPSHRHPNAHMLTKSVVIGLSKAMARAGIPGTAHSLRRWFATTMVEQGVDVRVVQVLLGHESLATTQRYLYVQPARAADAVCRLPLLE